MVWWPQTTGSTWACNSLERCGANDVQTVSSLLDTLALPWRLLYTSGTFFMLNPWNVAVTEPLLRIWFINILQVMNRTYHCYCSTRINTWTIWHDLRLKIKDVPKWPAHLIPLCGMCWCRSYAKWLHLKFKFCLVFQSVIRNNNNTASRVRLFLWRWAKCAVNKRQSTMQKLQQTPW